MSLFLRINKAVCMCGLFVLRLYSPENEHHASHQALARFESRLPMGIAMGEGLIERTLGDARKGISRIFKLCYYLNDLSLNLLSLFQWM